MKTKSNTYNPELEPIPEEIVSLLLKRKLGNTAKFK